ncbi:MULTISPECIES: I78 family peptidase inhibitor [Luteimonas]|uniref:I78 family peptidase inhibitor n=1 Tax=Luteimonas TaxID=83614 RepID=UPI000C7E4505|nr:MULTISPECIES: I78 family peptidase inhibitor [Luteimonas]
MSPRFPRTLPRALLATALTSLFTLAACAPADQEGFEEEPPVTDTATDADTGAGSPIETDASRSEIADNPDATPPAATPPGATPCDTETVQSLIGETGNEALYQKAQQDSGAKQFRALGPTDMATMDFREDRLNIDLDADGKITGFRCG